MKESYKKLPTEEESAKNWEAFNDKMEMDMIEYGHNHPIITKDIYKVSGSDLMYMCPRCFHEQKKQGKCEKCNREHGVSYRKEEWETTYNKRVEKALGVLLAVLIGLIIYGILL